MSTAIRTSQICTCKMTSRSTRFARAPFSFGTLSLVTVKQQQINDQILSPVENVTS